MFRKPNVPWALAGARRQPKPCPARPRRPLRRRPTSHVAAAASRQPSPESSPPSTLKPMRPGILRAPAAPSLRRPLSGALSLLPSRPPPGSEGGGGPLAALRSTSWRRRPAPVGPRGPARGPAREAPDRRGGARDGGGCGQGAGAGRHSGRRWHWGRPGPAVPRPGERRGGMRTAGGTPVQTDTGTRWTQGVTRHVSVATAHQGRGVKERRWRPRRPLKSAGYPQRRVTARKHTHRGRGLRVRF